MEKRDMHFFDKHPVLRIKPRAGSPIQKYNPNPPPMTFEEAIDKVDQAWFRDYPMTIDEMVSSSPSVDYILSHPSNDPERDLANAIIATAVDDYRMALRKNRVALVKELTGFFHSKLYSSLTDINPDYLIAQLQIEYLRSAAASAQTQ